MKKAFFLFVLFITTLVFAQDTLHVPADYTTISSSQFVSIKVYDILGSEIETLVNEEKPAGIYKLTWNAGNLPSGVYFYRIIAGAFVQTKKMILIK